MRLITELTGRYHLQELIAVGGMGDVWRAVDQVLARPVAVKLLRPEYTRDTVALARFRAEAQHAGRPCQAWQGPGTGPRLTTG